MAATLEETVATVEALKLELEALKAQTQNVLTQEQGERLVQDANARELAQLQKSNERDEWMRRMEVRMTTAEGRTTDEKKCIGYINMKNKEPKVFGEKPEEWRKWKDVMEDFLDAHNTGIKKVLKKCRKPKKK